MTHPAKAPEPPMDEIIASIRRMISHEKAVDDEMPVTSEPAPSPAAPPLATSATPVSTSLTGPAPSLRTSAPSAPVFPTRAGPDGTDVRFGKRAFVGQSFAPAPHSTPSSSAANPMSGQASLDTAAATRAAFRKTETTTEPARTEAGSSDTDDHPVRSNAAESPMAREVSQPPDGAQSLSPATAAAVGAALDALARRVAAQNPRTLEDVVGDTLRPLLKAWLDDNLPHLVERLVRAEIERISRWR